MTGGEAPVAGAGDVGATRRFDFPAMARVWYGLDAIGELGGELDRLGRSRALIVTSPSVAERTPVVARTRAALGDRVAGCFAAVEAHAPIPVALAAADAARRAAADVVVSVGGGSAIECGKAVALAAAAGWPDAERFARLAIHGTARDGFGVPALDGEPLPHIAVPTTLSGAEFGPTFTLTDPATSAKVMFHHPRAIPLVAALDQGAAAATPSTLWATAGVRALDHCVEWCLSRARMPFTDALAKAALIELVASLPPSVAEPPDADARGRCQVAAWMSVYGSHNVLGGLSHAIGHQLGSHCGIAHGHTSCIVLPRVLEFNLPESVDRLADLAVAFGRTDGTAAERARGFIDDLAAFIASLGMPTRLADVGAADADLDAIARATMREVAVVNNPRAASEADVRQILERCR